MAVATYSVHIGFERAVGGTFRLDFSRLDSTDVLSNDFTQFFTGANDDVTNDADNVKIRRGRTSVLGQVEAGEVSFTLSRPSAPDRYNPQSPTSPLASLDPGFKPMRPVRIQATFAAVTYTLFYGFIRSAVFNPDTYETTVIAQDLLLWLSRIRPTIAATGATTTGAAIGKVLDGAGWTDATLRSLATGDALADFSADASKTCLELINDLLEAERGVFYVAGSVARYEDRAARAKRTTASATFTDAALSVDPRIDLDNIRNRVTVTGATGAAQTAELVSSEQDYGLADLPAIATAYIPNASGALALANYILGIQSQTRSPAFLGLDNESSAILTSILSLELQDRIALTETLTGTTGAYHVEQVEHEIGPSGLYHRTSYVLSARGAEAFILDYSTLDGADVLGL